MTKEVVEVYLGDYIDRGSHSAAVVSRLIERSDQVRARFLRGNHEQLLLDFIHGGDRLDEWKAVGGTATLLSYGISPDLLKHGTAPEKVRSALVDKVPKAHHAFYQATGSYLVIGDYIAVHAGLRPRVSLEKQAINDLLSIRGEFLEHTGDFGYIVVHGHTPVPARTFVGTGSIWTRVLLPATG